MKCNILHESPNRLRVHLHCARMSLHEADLLEYYLRSVDGVTEVTVYDRTQDAVVRYTGQRSAVIGALASFSFAKAEAMELVPEHTSRDGVPPRLALRHLRRPHLGGTTPGRP